MHNRTDLESGPHYTLAWRAHRDASHATAARYLGMTETARSFERSSLAAEIALVALQPLCSRDYADDASHEAQLGCVLEEV